MALMRRAVGWGFVASLLAWLLELALSIPFRWKHVDLFDPGWLLGQTAVATLIFAFCIGYPDPPSAFLDQLSDLDTPSESKPEPGARPRS